MDRVGHWHHTIQAYPGFAEWKRKQISATLWHGDPWVDMSRDADTPSEFKFDAEVEKQHDAVTSYFALYTTYLALMDTQFYFRRYPFSNLPVSRQAHLRYVCEMYFSRVYEFSERMKKCLNLIQKVVTVEVAVGPVIKQFAKDFRDELKERNLIHHHTEFSDIVIDKIGLLDLLTLKDRLDEVGRGWKAERKALYRKASREWAERVRRRSKRASVYVEAMAKLMTDHCTFLQETTPAYQR